MVGMRYKVHSAVDQPTQIPAKAGGRDVIATVTGFVVELVPDEGELHGSITLTFVPDSDGQHKELRDVYTVGNNIELTAEKV